MSHIKSTFFLIILFIFIICAGNLWTQEAKEINFTGNKFNSILLDEADSSLIWFGTKAGIIQYNRKENKWIYPKNNVLCVNIIKNDIYEKDIIWLGTDNGIQKYNRSSGKIEIIKTGNEQKKIDTTLQLNEDTSQLKHTDSTQLKQFDSTHNKEKEVDSTQVYLEDFKVKDILIDTIDNDNIWFATQNGLLKHSRKNKNWVNLTKNDGLTDNEVNVILIDKFNTNYIWVGTRKGINLLEREKDTIKISALNTEKTISVHAIAIDGMYVLFGTSSGIDIYNKNYKT
ncbi:MAG: hypothetical protein HY934_05055, partial [Candidatus Firestonebacteria bacterium]|nr:hypothetical protein [Candidatus Firestonebacteria bacterium]